MDDAATRKLLIAVRLSTASSFVDDASRVAAEFSINLVRMHVSERVYESAGACDGMRLADEALLSGRRVSADVEAKLTPRNDQLGQEQP